MNPSIPVKLTIIGLLSILMLLPSMVTAQQSDRFERQVAIQLVAAAMAFDELSGYELTHEPFTGKLYTRKYEPQSKYLTLRLYQGTSYAILGVCDEDCSDIDIDLYDDNGNRISTDHQPDDKALVGVSPKWTAIFRVKITIPSCSEYRCTYGVGVFGN